MITRLVEKRIKRLVLQSASENPDDDNLIRTEKLLPFWSCVPFVYQVHLDVCGQYGGYSVPEIFHVNGAQWQLSVHGQTSVSSSALHHSHVPVRFVHVHCLPHVLFCRLFSPGFSSSVGQCKTSDESFLHFIAVFLLSAFNGDRLKKQMKITLKVA